jgi:hypothetical protein
MRELELFSQYLTRLRQERLQQAHARALATDVSFSEIKICAHEAELCTRIQAALKALDHDAGRFIREFLEP